MSLSTPTSMWTNLPSERRRHVSWGAVGIAISWTFAGLMAHYEPFSSNAGSGTARMQQASNSHVSTVIPMKR